MTSTTVRSRPGPLRSARGRTASAVALAAVLAVSGCGGSSDSSDEPLTKDNLVSEMKAAVEDQSGAHLDMKLTGAANVTASGDIDYAAKDPAMALSMSGLSSSDMQMRVVDKIIYISAPPATPEGKFLRIDPSDPSNPMGGQLDDLLTQADPMSSFEGWDKGLKTVKYVGEEKVDGEQLDHYTVAIDAATAMKASGSEMPQGMPDTLTYQLWLDDENLMRQLTFDLGPVAMKLSIDQWGEPVDVEVPPKSDIVDVPQG